MISRISFIKLVKEDLKRRSWLTALLFLIFFIALPIVCLMGVNQFFGYMYDSTSNKVELAQTWYVNYLSIDNSFTVFLVVIFAAICGITGYQYLHSRTKIDLYHSIPVRREALFLVQYTCGFLIFAVPYILNVILCIIIGNIRGVMLASHWSTILGTLGFNLIFFLLIYSVIILAMMLTGKILIAILGSAVFLFSGPLVQWLFTALQAIYFSTYFSDSYSSLGDINMKLSPLTIYMEAINKWGDANRFPWIYCLITILIIMILVLINIWIYRHRNSERAEYAMSFPILQPIIKILLVVPASLGCGILFKAVSGTESDWWLVFGIVFGAFIVNGIIEFIYHMDLKEIFKRKITLILGIVLPLLIVALYRFDVTGYDSYIPKESSIESMSIYSDELNPAYNYPYNSSMNNMADVLNNTQTKDFSPIYELVKEGITYAENNEADNEVYNDYIYDDEIKWKWISVGYQLESGKYVYRSYTVPIDTYEECMTKLYEIGDFNRKIVPINYLDTSTIANIYVYDILGESTKLRLTQEEMQELIDAYTEDASQVSYEESLNAQGVSLIEFEISLPEYNYGSIFSSVIYASYTNTMSFLQDYDFYGAIELTADDVASIELNIYGDYPNNSYSFKDESSITEILENVNYFPDSDYPYTYYEELGYYVDFEITINLKDSSYDPIYVRLPGRKIPECIMDILE